MSVLFQKIPRLYPCWRSLSISPSEGEVVEACPMVITKRHNNIKREERDFFLSVKLEATSFLRVDLISPTLGEVRRKLREPVCRASPQAYHDLLAQGFHQLSLISLKSEGLGSQGRAQRPQASALQADDHRYKPLSKMQSGQLCVCDLSAQAMKCYRKGSNSR